MTGPGDTTTRTPGTAAPERRRAALRDHVVMAYPTPIVVYPWPDSDTINAELYRVIAATSRASDGITKSNVGGWHSDLDFFTWDAACVKALLGRIETLTIELTGLFMDPQNADRRLRFSVEGWANLLRPGGYHNVHNHPNAHWSGVYYVSDNPVVAGRPMSGKLELIDPRPAATMLLLDHTTIYGRQLIDPRAGTMVVFPAWLQHQVHPYFGPGERITISFNIIVTPVAETAGAPGGGG